MQDSLPAGGLRLYREGVEPSGSLRKVSGYITILLSRTCPVARVVYAKRPFAGPEAMLAYLGRYTHRVAIANSRLVALAGGEVSFRWRDYRHHNKNKVMTLALRNSSAASCCMPYQMGSIASAITVFLPTTSAPTSSPSAANCWLSRLGSQPASARNVISLPPIGKHAAWAAGSSVWVG